MGDLTRDAQEAHPLTVSVEANKMKALDLRGEGKSYAKIADALGISKTRAHELVLEGLDELMVQSAESAEQVRILELGRLDDMLDRMLVKLSLQRREMATKDGQKVFVPDPQERTVEGVLKIMERRAKLLGLDAPLEIVGAGGGPVQVSNVAASEEFIGRVEKLIARLDGGETPEAVAASLRQISAGDVTAPSANGHDKPSTNGAAP